MESSDGLYNKPPAPRAPQHGPPGSFAQQQAQQQNYFSRPHRQRNTLPPPAELAQRIEEARTSAKLLAQVVATTPPNEVIRNELIKEFVERCQSASRSVQAYIHADNPAPDEDTLLTLIETNDQLASAISRHQRALLEARKRAGATSGTSSPNPQAMSSHTGVFEAPTEMVPPPPGPPPGRKPLNGRLEENQNPFGDHNEAAHPGYADLQAPLQPQVYGLPPQGFGEQNIGNPPYSNTRSMSPGNGEPGGLGKQDPKPRYRF